MLFYHFRTNSVNFPILSVKQTAIGIEEQSKLEFFALFATSKIIFLSYLCDIKDKKLSVICKNPPAK